MNILISQKVIFGKFREMDALEREYHVFFKKIFPDSNIIPIPNLPNFIDDYFSNFKIDAVIISGGNDIDPLFYGGQGLDGLEITKLRDKTEEKIVRLAIKKKIPILGICRGMQFLNVYFKGKLSKIDNHAGKNHLIDIVDNKIGKRLGPKIEINSFHNWGIKTQDLGKDLITFASTEGLIEGFYHKNLKILGVQWHPERETKNENIDKLIIDFISGEKIK